MSQWDKGTLKKIPCKLSAKTMHLLAISLGKSYDRNALEELTSTPLEQHLVQHGRIHKPELDYVIRFLKPFIHFLRSKLSHHRYVCWGCFPCEFSVFCKSTGWIRLGCTHGCALLGRLYSFSLHRGFQPHSLGKIRHYIHPPSFQESLFWWLTSVGPVVCHQFYKEFSQEQLMEWMQLWCWKKLC